MLCCGNLFFELSYGARPPPPPPSSIPGPFFQTQKWCRILKLENDRFRYTNGRNWIPSCPASSIGRAIKSRPKSILQQSCIVGWFWTKKVAFFSKTKSRQTRVKTVKWFFLANCIPFNRKYNRKTHAFSWPQAAPGRAKCNGRGSGKFFFSTSPSNLQSNKVVFSYKFIPFAELTSGERARASELRRWPMFVIS